MPAQQARKLAGLGTLRRRVGGGTRAVARGRFAQRRLGGAAGGGDEVRFSARVGNDRRLGWTERRLGGGDAIRRRSRVAPAGHARAGLERMVGRQVRIDRPAFAADRRSGLGWARRRYRRGRCACGWARRVDLGGRLGRGRDWRRGRRRYGRSGRQLDRDKQPWGRR